MGGKTIDFGAGAIEERPPVPHPVNNGQLAPPERPGHGLAPDRKKLEHFKLS